MKRHIISRPYTITSDVVSPPFTDDASLRVWLDEMMGDHGLEWLLAHADDGVIWGRRLDGKLSLSSDYFPADITPTLRLLTLHQVRLFGPQREVLLWRDGQGQWRWRLLDDEGDSQRGWQFDEAHLQWGDHAEDMGGPFTLVAEGQEGLRHSVPLPQDEIPFDDPAEERRDRWHPLRLRVRHYLQPDGDGMLHIRHSRLIQLDTVPRPTPSEEAAHEPVAKPR